MQFVEVTGSTTLPRGRLAFAWLILLYAALVVVCLGAFVMAGDLSLGRNPWSNLVKSLGDFARPSFVDLWFGPERLEFRSDDGTLLRVENRRLVEADFLAALARASWVTFQIATLGSLLAAVMALPLGILTARNLHAPRPLAYAAKAVLDATRAIHTLVFGLVLVGIVGLGPTAGILAIAMHSMGTYGKLFAESIETLDMGSVDAVRPASSRVFVHHDATAARGCGCTAEAPKRERPVQGTGTCAHAQASACLSP